MFVLEFQASEHLEVERVIVQLVSGHPPQERNFRFRSDGVFRGCREAASQAFQERKAAQPCERKESWQRERLVRLSRVVLHRKVGQGRDFSQERPGGLEDVRDAGRGRLRLVLLLVVVDHQKTHSGSSPS